MGLGRILVVDDEAHIRTTVKMVLTKAGYDVVEAEDGERESMQSRLTITRSW